METCVLCPRNQHSLMFKSYYVVWKPDGKFKGVSRPVMFKSYYVVWKPDAVRCANYTYNSLNRTMQYGNPMKQSFNL